MSTNTSATDPITPEPPGMFNSPWATYLLPLVVFLAMGTLEPPPPPDDPNAEPPRAVLGLRYEHYPIIYTVKIVLVAAAIAAVWGGYPPLARISTLAVVVGVAGVVAWIALAKLQRASGLNETLAEWGMGTRSAYNPLEQFNDRPSLAYAFLAVRFIGLAVIVPIIEEMFLRGFLMRYFVRSDWWNVPFGTYDQLGFLAAVVLPVLMHPHEALAAAVWFAAVGWLLLRTRNVWDCVVAHAITNALLGVYVVTAGEWWLM